MKKRQLGKTGLEVSSISYGAAPLGGAYGDVDAAELVRAVHCAIDLEINLFDTAPYYGITRSETVLGECLRGVPRHKYLLASKVGRYDSAEFDFSAERVTRSVDESLKRLQTDFVDIMTIHDIEFGSFQQIIEETIPTMRKMQAAGKVKFVGFSGLPLKIYPAILDHVATDTIITYCHHCLNDTSLVEMLPYLELKEVGVMNASPMAMGLLAGANPPDWHPAPPELRAACTRVVEFCREQGKSLPQLALQYSISNPGIATTLVGMRTQREVEANSRWAGEALDESLLKEVLTLLEPVHNMTWSSGGVGE